MQNEKVCLASAWLCAKMCSDSADTFCAETESVILFHARDECASSFYEGLTLFNPFGHRKYINAGERWRFIEADLSPGISSKNE
jgi:hypothetical protein